jgi:hypothetical protein
MNRFMKCIALLVLGVALASCGKSSKSLSSVSGGNVNPATPEAQTQVVQQVVLNPQLSNETLVRSGSTTSASMAPVGVDGLLPPPPPWRRHITSVTDSTLSKTFSDPDSVGNPTMAHVLIQKTFRGTLDQYVRTRTGQDSLRLSKPLEDHWVRKLDLRRVRVWVDSLGVTHTKWHIVGTSGVNVTSSDAATLITSIRLQGVGLDTTVTDPLAMVRMRRMVALPDSVHITVTVNSNNADVFLYRGLMRRRITSNGDGTYSADLRLGLFVWGIEHFAVDALSFGTLHDDAAPYSSNAWVLPFGHGDRDQEVESNDDHR